MRWLSCQRKLSQCVPDKHSRKPASHCLEELRYGLTIKFKGWLANVESIILPGIGDSDPAHWQSLWWDLGIANSRIRQDDWDNPVCSDWLARLEETVRAAGPDTILIAHSLSCLVVAHWAALTKLRIRGALLVAPPDPDGSGFPMQALGFSGLPNTPLGFKTILVASTNDPYARIEFAQACATAWACEFANIGDAGHINSDSGLGAWPEGQALLKKLIAETAA